MNDSDGAGQITKALLVNAALEYLKLNGVDDAVREPGTGAAMILRRANGENIRIRTCKDPVLLVVADEPHPNAKLNIENTSHLLIVMPQCKRSFGPVNAYLIPTELAVGAARRSHTDWLAAGPKTKGNNKTWYLDFEKHGESVDSGSGFAEKWAEYRLKGEVSIEPSGRVVVGAKTTEESETPGLTLTEEVTRVRRHLSKLAGVPETAVQISIAF